MNAFTKVFMTYEGTICQWDILKSFVTHDFPGWVTFSDLASIVTWLISVYPRLRPLLKAYNHQGYVIGLLWVTYWLLIVVSYQWIYLLLLISVLYTDLLNFIIHNYYISVSLFTVIKFFGEFIHYYQFISAFIHNF